MSTTRVNTHLEAAAPGGVGERPELRDFTWPKVADAASLPTLTVDEIGTIYTAEDTGINYQMRGVDVWVPWQAVPLPIEALDTETVAPVHGQTVIAHPGSTIDIAALVGTAFKVEVMHPADGGWGTAATWSLDDGGGTVIAQPVYTGGQAWIVSAGADIHLVYTESDPMGIGPVNNVVPVISGTAVVGQTLTLDTLPDWTPPTITESYVWQLNGVDIPGTANQTTYVVQAGDDGGLITVRASATNNDGTTSVSSNSLGPVTTPAPVFTSLDTAPMFSVGSSGTIAWALTNATSAQIYAGTVGDTSTPVAGATTAGYTDTDWQVAEAGDYWVRAAGPGGTVDSAQITVSVAASRTATLSYDPATTSTLRFNGGNLPNSGSFTIDWGDGSPVEGPFSAQGLRQHAFTGTGSGTVVVTFDVTNGPTGFVQFAAAANLPDWQVTPAELDAVGGGFMVSAIDLLNTGATGNVIDFPRENNNRISYSNTSIAGTTSDFPIAVRGIVAEGVPLTGHLANLPAGLDLNLVLNGAVGVTGDLTDIAGFPTTVELGGTSTTAALGGIPAFMDILTLSSSTTGAMSDTHNAVRGLNINDSTAVNPLITALPTALESFRGLNVGFTSYTATTPADLTVALLSGNAFDVASVDKILADLDANGRTNGNLDLSGGTSAVPTGGLANPNRMSLIAKGWLMSTNL